MQNWPQTPYVDIGIENPEIEQMPFWSSAKNLLL